MKLLLLLRGWHEGPDGPLRPELLGPVERTALGTAMALRDGREGASAVALTAGDEREDKMLLGAQALGVDETYRIWDPLVGKVDSVGVARSLAYSAKRIGYDVILAGMRSADHGEGVLGPAVAELLGIVHLTGVVQVEWSEDPKKIRARRWSGSSLFTHELTLPCVLTVADGPDPGPCPADPPAAGAKGPKLLTFDDVALSGALVRSRTDLQGAIVDRKNGVERETTRVKTGGELIAHLLEGGLIPSPRPPAPARKEPGETGSGGDKA